MEGTDNGRQKTRNHGYDVIVGGELFTDYSDHPRKLVTLNSKLKSTGAGRYASFLLVGCSPQAAWPERLSPKSCDAAVALQQIKERGALPMIDRGDIRQAIDRCSNIWLHCWRWLWSASGAQGWQPGLGKIQRSGRNGQRLMYEQSHRDYLRSGYLHHRLPVMGWVNHYRDNAITYKAQRDKMPENWSWRTRHYWHADASAWCCCAWCKIHVKGVSLMLKLKMMLCVMMLPPVVVGCTSKQSVSQCVKPPPPPARIMQPPRLADTAERDYFTFRERLITMQKQLKWTQKYINEQCR